MPFDCENLISGLNSVLHQKTKYNKFDYGFQLYVVSGAENAILDEMASSGWDSDSSKVCDVVGFQKVLKTAAVKNVSSIIRSDMIALILLIFFVILQDSQNIFFFWFLLQFKSSTRLQTFHLMGSKSNQC